jgi:hypothetical protein
MENERNGYEKKKILLGPHSPDEGRFLSIFDPILR